MTTQAGESLAPHDDGENGRRSVVIGCDSTSRQQARFVGKGKFVLALGMVPPDLARALRARGCRMVALTAGVDGAEGGGPAYERVVVAELESSDWAAELGELRFDVILVQDALERVREPKTLLRKLAKYLRRRGRLIASAANAAHGTIRLTLLAGSLPHGIAGSPDDAPRRIFTLDTLQTLLEKAGYAVGRIECQQKPIQLAELPADEQAMLRNAAEALNTDSDALVDRFTVAAHPLPHSHMVLWQRRILRLAQAAEWARRQLASHGAMLKALRLELEREVADHIRSGEELEHCRALISNLRSQLAERMAVSRHAAKEFAERNDRIFALEERLGQQQQTTEACAAEFAERLRLERELAERRARCLRDAAQAANGELEEARRMFLVAQEQLLHRDEEIRAAIADAFSISQAKTGSARAQPTTSPSALRRHIQYQGIVQSIRKVVDAVVPPGGTVAVVSRGDPELLRLGARRACHFMQDAAGGYAGHNPADSADAVNRLETLRAQGTDYLVLPQTTLWWLDHYSGFRQHLHDRYSIAASQENVCLIFALRDPPLVATTSSEPGGISPC